MDWVRKAMVESRQSHIDRNDGPEPCMRESNTRAVDHFRHVSTERPGAGAPNKARCRVWRIVLGTMVPLARTGTGLSCGAVARRSVAFTLSRGPQRRHAHASPFRLRDPAGPHLPLSAAKRQDRSDCADSTTSSHPCPLHRSRRPARESRRHRTAGDRTHSRETPSLTVSINWHWPQNKTDIAGAGARCRQRYASASWRHEPCVRASCLVATSKANI